MNTTRQTWLVAVREMRERARSRAFQVSMLVMILLVVGAVLLPSLVDTTGGTKHVGVTGTQPAQLAGTIQLQGFTVGTTVRVHRYDTVAEGEQAVRDDEVAVLVIDGRRLEWRRAADEQLRAVVTSAIQLVAVRARANAAGVDPDALLALVAPVDVDNVTLGSVAGRGPEDEAAAMLMTVLLFVAIATYGNLVLTGVLEEKTSRVVEVLLARMSPRALLAGKVLGIGLLGFAQFLATAAFAVVVSLAVDPVDIPAARATVIAWVVVWFVLGYSLYAMVYGALGSLASRLEDAQSVAGPLMALMVAAYFASFAAVGRPDSAAAQIVSYLPVTAPLAMPNRIAMGATEWWEPVLALALTLMTIAWLVRFSGRVYANAVLHSGPALRLRDAWRASRALAQPKDAEHSGVHEGGEGDRDDAQRQVADRDRVRRGRHPHSRDRARAPR